MRVTCPKCKSRFDVAHAAIIKEANRLKEKRNGNLVNVASDVDGNQRDNRADEILALLPQEFRQNSLGVVTKPELRVSSIHRIAGFNVP